jgi:hypothetical protein
VAVAADVGGIGGGERGQEGDSKLHHVVGEKFLALFLFKVLQRLDSFLKLLGRKRRDLADIDAAKETRQKSILQKTVRPGRNDWSR